MGHVLFPAQAGVIPTAGVEKIIALSVPRASGGDPTNWQHTEKALTCSPRKRG